MQPTYSDLFKNGATFNEQTQKLEIPLSALQASGLSTNSPTALETWSALVKNAHEWLSANVDVTVMATSELNVFAPTSRNNEPRTQFNFSFGFYGGYSAPTFDPDDV